VEVTGPLGKSVVAEYGIISAEGLAVLEMSAAAGITLVPEEKRNPLYTTTRGVGEMILDAISKGCRKFIIGIGGSATNDGGVGMLKALGFEFLDERGEPIADGAIGLSALHRIVTDKAIRELAECEIRVACDVSNPLCGDSGCSRIYGPQKGADEKMIADMDGWLSHYAKLTREHLPGADADFPGVGAAGGLGFALKYYLGAILGSGIGLVMDAIRLEEHIIDADIVITGEGRLDSQSAMGKAPVGVARLAKKHGKRGIAFAGAVSIDIKHSLYLPFHKTHHKFFLNH
jgi:glycerate kinase